MPDVASIIATLAAIKNSMDIVKAVKDADYDLDKAILKEKIVILLDSLLEAKIQAGETLDLIQEKDKKIVEPEDLLNFRAKLVRKNGVYFESGENNEPIGEPFCSHCWDDLNKPIHLTWGKNYSQCPKCKNLFPNNPNNTSVDRILSSKNSISRKLREF